MQLKAFNKSMKQHLQFYCCLFPVPYSLLSFSASVPAVTKAKTVHTSGKSVRIKQ